MRESSAESGPNVKRSQRRSRLRWLYALIASSFLFAFGYHFRRQIFVWFVLDAGGATVSFDLVPAVLETRYELLDEKLAARRAQSEAEAVQFLRELLSGTGNALYRELNPRYA